MTDFSSPDPLGTGGNKPELDVGTLVVARSTRPGPVNANALERSPGAQFDIFSGETYQARANAVAAEVTRRGRFTGKGEADWIYQNNSDRQLFVIIDASTLAVTITGSFKPDPNGGHMASARVAGEDYWIHGQVTARIRPDGTAGIYNQLYHYEMHADPSLKGFVRNIATFMGEPPAGMPNTPFRINYTGNTAITNREVLSTIVK